MIKFKQFIFVLTILALVNCSGIENKKIDVNEILVGHWSIDTFYLKEKNMRYCFSINMIILSKLEKVQLPVTFDTCNGEFASERKGSWQIIYENARIRKLKIESLNMIFSDSYRFRCRKDLSNRLLKMELESKDKYLVLRKGFLDFEDNIKNMDMLIELTD